MCPLFSYAFVKLIHMLLRERERISYPVGYLCWLSSNYIVKVNGMYLEGASKRNYMGNTYSFKQSSYNKDSETSVKTKIRNLIRKLRNHSRNRSGSSYVCYTSQHWAFIHDNQKRKKNTSQK